MDDDIQSALDYLEFQVSAKGIGVLTVDDGTIFSFSLEALERLVKIAEKKDTQVLTMFVKHDKAEERS